MIKFKFLNFIKFRYAYRSIVFTFWIWFVLNVGRDAVRQSKVNEEELFFIFRSLIPE